MSFVFNPEAIERELTTLQRSLSPFETRAVLYNLVVVHGPESEKNVENVLGFLLGKRPARIIRIVTTDKPESGIHVSVRCFPDREEKGVCFQEIIIESGKDGAGAATGSWTPLLIREIPVYLWWLDGLVPPPALLFASIEHVDKIIIDSFAREQAGEHASEVFGGFVNRALSEGIPVADMAWRRLSTLRHATARIFDTGSMRQCLHEILHITIRGGTEVASVLFISWLADRLRWTLDTDRDGKTRAFVDQEGRTVTWNHEDSGPATDGMVIRFSLESCDELVIRTDPAGFARFTTPYDKTRTVPFVIPEEGRLLMEELDYPYHDYLFAEVVKNIGCILGSGVNRQGP